MVWFVRVVVASLWGSAQRLFEHVLSADGHYRDELIDKIIFICSRDKYDFLEDFAWCGSCSALDCVLACGVPRYVAMLVKLAGIKGTRHGGSICEQLLNVAMRVERYRCASCCEFERDVYARDAAFARLRWLRCCRCCRMLRSRLALGVLSARCGRRAPLLFRLTV